MNIEDFQNYCLNKKGVSQSFPFGGDALVFKVLGKMFTVIGIDTLPHKANLKCDPDLSLELRDKHDDIQPGFHMNKKHWNTVLLDGSLDYQLLCRLIDHSYELVCKSLTKAQHESLKNMK